MHKQWEIWKHINLGVVQTSIRGFKMHPWHCALWLSSTIPDLKEFRSHPNANLTELHHVFYEPEWLATSTGPWVSSFPTLL